jgi:hypothetical protein
VKLEPRRLPPRYYLANFQRLCDTVVDQYGDLLAAAVEAGLLAREDSPGVDTLQAVLRRAELEQIYGERLPSPPPTRKPELVAAINAQLTEPEWLALWRDWRGDESWLVAVRHRDTVALLQLLFFGNAWQGLTEFVLSDLGIASYHPYPLSRRDRLFRDRAEIDEVLALEALKAAYKQAATEGDTGTVLAVARLLDAPGAGPHAARQRDRLRNRVARQLERVNAAAAAEALYAGSRQPPARERRARLLASRGDVAAALRLCEQIQQEPWCETEVDFAARQIPALKRKLKQKCRPRPRDCFETETLYLPRAAPVELAAARHYAADWRSVHYVENLLINGSFGLAFWDEIFSAAPGAFVHPFQSAPLDMFSREFRSARRDAIDRRLAALEQVDLAAELLSAYRRHYGVSNAWVGWRGLDAELLQAALATIPRAHWLAIWRRLLFDPQANRNGCPDLLALDPRRGYCLIEVKGPGDQLQLNQRRWLRFFQARGIPAKVAFVQWQEPTSEAENIRGQAQ